MINYNRLLPLLIVALISVNSCKNDGCNDPIAFNYDPDGSGTETCVYEPKQISLEVEPVFGSQQLVLDDTITMDDRTQISISYFGVYLSNLSFKESGEDDYQRWNGNDVALIKDGQLSTDAVYLNNSTIEAFRFDVGVDTAIYSGDPMDTSQVDPDSPLALQVPSMYWSWATGYRFVSIEGQVDTSASKDGSGMTSFGFHCGLPANLKTVILDSVDIVPVGNKVNLTIEMDVKQLLSGIDFENDDLIIHDGNTPETIGIMNKALDAFTIK